MGLSSLHPNDSVMWLSLSVPESYDTTLRNSPLPNTNSESSLAANNSLPSFVHKWSHGYSIISVVALPQLGLLWVGTQNGKILVLDLDAYEKRAELSGHAGSVLCLAASSCEQYVFSAGCDSLVKVWSVKRLEEMLTIYSLVDIGDIFSIAWSQSLKTLYFGAQNASVSWVTLDLGEDEDHRETSGETSDENRNETPSEARGQSQGLGTFPLSHANTDSSTVSSTISSTGSSPSPSTVPVPGLVARPDRLPSRRWDKFFDSKGPGGSMNPLQTKSPAQQTSMLIEVPSANIKRYAHNGYVYAMKLVPGLDFGAFQAHELLFTSGGDGFVRIWGLAGGLRLLASLDNEDCVLCLDISGTYLYAGLTDGQVKIWDLSTLQLIKNLKFQAEGDVQAIATNNYCIFKVTKSGVYKWRLTGEKKEDWMAHGGNALAVSIFQRGGRYFLVSGGVDNSVIVWCLDDFQNPPQSSELQNFGNDHLLETLERFVAYQTVSKNPEQHMHDSRQCAGFLYRLFMRYGAVAELISTDCGNPIVYACFKAIKRGVSEARASDSSVSDSSDATGKASSETSKPSGNSSGDASGSSGDGVFSESASRSPCPRVLWYGHYDVIEAIDDTWHTNPFQLIAKNGNLYGRGVTDNKGPVLAAIFAVAELASAGELASDVVFLIEGEEEYGSRGFRAAVERNREQIGHIDWILLSNSYWLDDHTPCLNYGLRGVVKASVEIGSDRPDRHSGVDGGVSREPTMDLIRLLGTLSDDDGRVMVPDFYNTVKELSPEDIEYFHELADAIKVDVNPEALMRRWVKPSLTVHKVTVSGPDNNTVISQFARATLSIRTIPEQDTEAIKQNLEAYLEEKFRQLQSDNRLSVDVQVVAEPWLGDPRNAAFQILRQEIVAAWGVEPLFIREGGSIPTLRYMEKVFGAPVAQIPCGQASDNAHLDNEKLRVTNLFKLKEILKGTILKLPVRPSA
ncbi:hypothetical protein BABINDRAFT_159524 [Babjeviella inositovora NRRL Y-12698]|uniref:Peptidase M20 dimerisation domain-containing protein n=1 Tax=Babjeviella inositovora NRRL Y-12698 TaxID=984486 RepID=A0A1E3R135_9ASCO|nr:uncharacterized protein BABINDRAFT_159524 [Babjeviella inositovora NRRL Y-12698]ODQ83062.1 hypothetical protein BABINDRAFT_159524 [Babjeviella inositovora NRRL Y-12698]